jgi:pimeloyl-ACP methyl ester carboxylesterase
MEIPMTLRGRVACGTLVVPENRERPSEAGLVRIAVAVLRSSSPSPEPDPVLFLEGGPGDPTLFSLEDWEESPFLRKRHLILFDQRGTGFSTPSLECPELYDMWDRTRDRHLTAREHEEELLSAVGACAVRLRGLGVSLECYNTAASAADVEDLRRALGISQWNLYGISYGTRLALEVMRRTPEGVRSAILDSCVPPQANEYEEAPENMLRAFRYFFDACNADSGCAAAFPDLERTFYETVERLNRKPLRLSLQHEDEPEPLSMLFTGWDLVNLLFDFLYDETLLPYFPLLLTQIRAGDTAALCRYYEEGNGWSSDGLYYSVKCRDEASANVPERVRDRLKSLPSALWGYDPFPGEFAACALWNNGTASPDVNAPVSGTIPTLVLAGSYDPITPPEWGRRVASNLEKAYFFEFAHRGHGTTFYGCPLKLALAFLDQTDHTPSASCEEDKPLTFPTKRNEKDSPYGIADPPRKRR